MTPARRSGQLPVPATSFIGRRQEADELCRLVRSSPARLLTLLGPGGVGKTRLALRVASQLAPDFPGGTCFIDLAPLTDPAMVPAALALSVEETAGHPPIDLATALLSQRRTLLVFDTFEHVQAASGVVLDLLARCPHVVVLVTSRSPLRVTSEQEYVVRPFATPRVYHINGVPDLESLARNDAMALYVQRARAVDPSFALTDENASTVGAICGRADGLPLAIELAASRAKVLTPSQLLSRMDDRLGLLTRGARDLPPRQQTLRRTFDWSYALLDQAERALFARLGVFSGGVTLDGAEAVTPLLNRDDTESTSPAGRRADTTRVLDALSGLVDHGLVWRDVATSAEGSATQPRFRMLGAIREYALERLEASGETQETQERYASYCIALAGEQESLQLLADLGDGRGRAYTLLPLGGETIAPLGEVGSHWGTASAFDLTPEELCAIREGTSDSRPDALAALTPREREVALLLAEGLTNRELARALTIAEKTASVHVERVLRKLNLHSRARVGALLTTRSTPATRAARPLAPPPTQAAASVVSENSLRH